MSPSSNARGKVGVLVTQQAESISPASVETLDIMAARGAGM